MLRLSESYQIKNVTLNNRIVMSPMCMYTAGEDGKATDWHFVHYGSRAVGGAGLIMLEATAVESRGRISTQDLGLWDDNQMEGLKRIVDFAHQQGIKVAIQLAHAGRKAVVPEQIVAPSAIPFKEEDQVPQALDEQGIEQVVTAFGEAARRAREIGFDIIEIHGAHGYLVHEFLSPLSNQRTDHYGGTLENRFRFADQVIQAVRNEWREENPLFARVSAVDYIEGGLTIEDTVEIARLMKKSGVDLIDVSSGAILPVRPPKIFPGFQIAYAEQIRREAKIPTGAVGLITSSSQAEEILGNERADLVFMGRELLRNPNWLWQVERERNQEYQGPEQYERGFK